MTDVFTLVQRPRPADTAVCLTATGWTDCDLDPVALGDDDGIAFAALGIARAVQSALPRDAAPLSPGGSLPHERPAARYVIDTAPPDLATLRRMHDLGVRGVRVRLTGDGGRLAAQLDAIDRTADAIAPLDWHLELLPGKDLASLARHETALTRLPVALCLSGIAPLMAALQHHDEGFDFILDLLHMGRTWLKLGGSCAGEGLRGFINEALAVRSDRLLWGSGSAGASRSPADRRGHIATSLAALEQMIPDEDDRFAVLIANPARLYGFC